MASGDNLPHHLPHQGAVVDRGRRLASSRDGLWPWYLITLVYLGFGVLILFDRWGEIGSLFEAPGAESKRLPLNSIGDILAGFFAPLAFLWLFVATQLQRKELRLQREELADTRAVLAEQRAELQRAAEESNQQTSIMQRTLDSSRSREIYDAFGLDLYYHARQCLKFSGQYVSLTSPEGHSWTTSSFGVYPTFKVDQDNPSSVDEFYESYQGWVEEMLLSYPGSRIKNSPQYSGILNVLKDTILFLEKVTRIESDVDNSLRSARISALRLVQLRSELIELTKDEISTTIVS